MLKTLRKKGVMKKILWVVAVIIILSFGVFGQAYLLNNRKQGAPDYAGKIFGRKISLEQYQKSFRMTEILAMIEHGENLRDIRSELDLDAQTWDRLILLHEARREHIRVSNKEVVERIQSYPFFQRDGQFDTRLYDQILRYAFRIHPREFEEGIRNSLKILKLYQKQTENIIIPNAQVFEAYKKAKDQVQVQYVLFPAKNYEHHITFDEIKAKDYFLTHREEFVEPPSINVAVLRFRVPSATKAPRPPAAVAPAAETSPAPAAPAADEKAQREEALAKARRAAQQLAGTRDIQTVAKTEKMALQTSGFFNMEKPDMKMGWPYPLMQKLFSLKKGDILGPVKTLHGYQVLQIIGKKGAVSPEYSAIKEKVRQAWLLHKAQTIAKQHAEDFLKKFKSERTANPSLTLIGKARQAKLTVEETPLFHLGDYIPGIGVAEDFETQAFRLTKDHPLSGQAIQTPNGYALLVLKKRKLATRKEFDADSDQFATRLLEHKRLKAFNQFATLLKLKADLEDNIPEITARQGRVAE